jgi:hypothetical protein
VTASFCTMPIAYRIFQIRSKFERTNSNVYYGFAFDGRNLFGIINL